MEGDEDTDDGAEETDEGGVVSDRREDRQVSLAAELLASLLTTDGLLCGLGATIGLGDTG